MKIEKPREKGRGLTPQPHKTSEIRRNNLRATNQPKGITRTPRTHPRSPQNSGSGAIEMISPINIGNKTIEDYRTNTARTISERTPSKRTKGSCKLNNVISKFHICLFFNYNAKIRRKIDIRKFLTYFNTINQQVTETQRKHKTQSKHYNPHDQPDTKHPRREKETKRFYFTLEPFKPRPTCGISGAEPRKKRLHLTETKPLRGVAHCRSGRAKPPTEQGATPNSGSLSGRRDRTETTRMAKPRQSNEYY